MWLCSKIQIATFHWYTDQWWHADADRCHWRHDRWPGRRQFHAPVRCSLASLSHTAVSRSSLASLLVADAAHDTVYAWRRTRHATWRRDWTCWCDQQLPVTCWAQQPRRAMSVINSQHRMNSAAAPETGLTPSQQVQHTDLVSLPALRDKHSTLIIPGLMFVHRDSQWRRHILVYVFTKYWPTLIENMEEMKMKGKEGVEGEKVKMWNSSIAFINSRVKICSSHKRTLAYCFFQTRVSISS